MVVEGMLDSAFHHALEARVTLSPASVCILGSLKRKFLPGMIQGSGMNPMALAMHPPR